MSTNANIRQRQCTMEVTEALLDTFDNAVKGGSPDVGKVVAIDSDGTVDLIATGEPVFGQLQTLYDDGMASVTDEGYVDLPTDGTAITYGIGLIGGATAGTVKTAGAGVGLNCIAVASAGANMVRAKLR